MAVLGRVVLTDDEVRAIGREIVLVDSTELNGLRSDFGLLETRWSVNNSVGAIHSLGLWGVGYPLFRWDAGAANDDTEKRFRRVKIGIFGT